MERGYVKLWRKIEDSAVFDDAHLYHLFSWLPEVWEGPQHVETDADEAE